MNERYRTALVLKDLQGLPPEEIAEVMEVSRANADVLVHRARASFKAVFTRLAGSDAAAPAALGLVLLPLSVPAALQALPPLPAHFAPLHAPVHPGIPAGAGPAGAGLFTKVGAALTTKAAIGAAAAALVIGGGVVAVKEAEEPPCAGGGCGVDDSRLSACAYTSLGTRRPHDGHWARHGVQMGTRDRACLDADVRRPHAGEHSGSGSHDSARHDAGDGGGSASMATHEGTTTTVHSGGDHSTTTTTHHNDDMTGSHDAGD